MSELRDWTRAADGRSNSSEEYNQIVRHVASLIQGDAHKLIGGDTVSTARLIVSQLAHVHGMVPLAVRPAEAEDTSPIKEERSSDAPPRTSPPSQSRPCSER